MQKGFAPILVLLGIALVLSIAGGAYYLGTQRNKISETKIQQERKFDAEKNAQQTPLLPTPIPSRISSPEPSPTSARTLKKIPLISTEGWKELTLEGVSFKIPPNWRYEFGPYSNYNAAFLYSPYALLPTKVFVDKYKGGSRREQFFGGNYYDCHEIFEEAMFGNITALQIAIDGGWCQGGGGGIVTVIGDKFVVFPDVFYDLDTKEIQRFNTRDTIISTLKILK